MAGHIAFLVPGQNQRSEAPRVVAVDNWGALCCESPPYGGERNSSPWGDKKMMAIVLDSGRESLWCAARDSVKTANVVDPKISSKHNTNPQSAVSQRSVSVTVSVKNHWENTVSVKTKIKQ